MMGAAKEQALKRWVETVGILAGILIVVAGVTFALVTGLDRVYGPVGLIVAVIGGLIVRFVRNASPVPEEKALTTGRAVQRPPDPAEKTKPQFKERI